MMNIVHLRQANLWLHLKSSFLALLLAGVSVNPAIAQTASQAEQLQKQAAQFQKGLAAADKGALDKAYEIWSALDEETQMVPELSRALRNNLAVVLIKQKRFEEAQKLLDSALQADRQVATTLDNLNQIYSYQAQKTYQKVFSKTPVVEPEGKWLFFNVKDARLPTANVVTEYQPPAGVERVKGLVEAWRKAWANQDIKRYLQHYDARNFIPKDGLAYDVWERSRHRSLTKPKFIKLFLDEVETVEVAPGIIRAKFLQRYHSDRFKDDVYKVLLWQNIKDDEWKIIQEVVIYGG